MPISVKTPSFSKQEIELLLEQFHWIESKPVQAAFLHLVTDAKTRPDYEVTPRRHGYISSFRYYRDSKWVYSFIPNKGSLLWYFRRPHLNEHPVDLEKLHQQFSDVHVTSGEEMTVRISDLPDACRIAKHIL